ncbi:Glycine cleavage system transcriptional activator GcvA [Candidatus Rhodobacter oscarellae]|uniref:Glycine cleavage system transcriptional activator GcvA n=1 Tax=Candidatus Rhodobacter oscarellae TaxID=1675527 RepID=A0A0J9E3F9_9RHOB|nr:LysR family transcriptional regulator [Candidatus Rhodobacter lobularis]KMW57232.1 Glycine cleavage system transcriptional activator GcvA [Candidatus Rhodobacter lobularis]
MQDANAISLNALRVFCMVAQHMSIRKASEFLAVTPGAVSHQIKALEQSLGVQLFVRRNNAIDLTEAGSRLFRQALPGLQMLHTALEDVVRDSDELRVRASMSFAMRWLIPKLHLFKSRHPNANVQVETFYDVDDPPTGTADVTIGYYRRDKCPDGAHILFHDVCRPYLAPGLLSKLVDPLDVASIPALQCTKGNWDWRLWLGESGKSDVQLNYAERFDLDDAGLRAATAGMGMVLSAGFMVEDDVAEGRLVPLPHSEDIHVGFYTLQIDGRETGLSRRFVRWLKNAADSPC